MVEPTYRSGVLSESGILPIAMGDVPASLEDIKRRRAIAAALATRSRPFPKTIGEGLTSMGEAFGDVMADRRLSEQERAYAGGRAADPLFRPPGSNPAAGAVAPAKPVAAIPAVEPGVDPRARIAAVANPNDPALRPAGVASPDPTQAGEQPPQVSPTATALEGASPTAGGDDPVWAARQGAIGGIESRGQPDPYQAVGAPTKYGRGLGRYQVVEANIAPWTQAALGQALTPQQYLASPQAQDAVFKHRFGQYVDQFGEEGAARAWFGGPGNVNKGDLTDVHKRLSIADYGKSYMAGLQAGTDPTRVAAYAPAGTATDAPSPAARGGMAIPPLAEENPVTPSDIMPAPRVMAEFKPPGGSGVVPGAAPATPASAAPGAVPAAPPALAGTRKPLGLPPAPDRAGEPLSDEELRGIAIMRKYPGDEQAQAQAKLLMEYGKSRRDEAYTRKVEEYKNRVDLESKRTLAEEEYTRNLPKTEQEMAERQIKIDDAREKSVLQARLGGREPEKFFTEFDKQKQAAITHAHVVNQIAIARDAINAGVITGTGAGWRIDAAKLADLVQSNKLPGTIASNTERMQAALNSMLSIGVQSMQGNDPKVSNADIDIARGTVAADPKLQLETIKRVMSEMERIGRAKLNDFEDQRDYYLKGTRAERAYQIPLTPTAPDQRYIDALIKNKNNADDRAEFDRRFGTGAAELEIARAKRRER